MAKKTLQKWLVYGGNQWYFRKKLVKWYTKDSVWFKNYVKVCCFTDLHSSALMLPRVYCEVLSLRNLTKWQYLRSRLLMGRFGIPYPQSDIGIWVAEDMGLYFGKKLLAVCKYCWAVQITLQEFLLCHRHFVFPGH